MIAGEIRKLLRNRVFVCIMAAVFAANIICILYCEGTQSEGYHAYMQEAQTWYRDSYQTYIGQMEKRGEELLSAADVDDFFRRNVEKTVKDYSGLKGVMPDAVYHAGVEEYAGYSYGIFFCIVFAFACLEYLYLAEKRNKNLWVLRSAKKGRWHLILTKWGIGLCLVSCFTLIEELATVFLYGILYRFGNMDVPVQSLPVFRDCPFSYSMWEAVVRIVCVRLLIAAVAASIILFCGTVVNNVKRAVVFPCVFFTLQYICSVAVPVNSSYDGLCCINLFYAWNMKHDIGVYHNLNIMGFPVEKNMAAMAAGILLILFAVVAGPYIFSIRYQTEWQKFEFPPAVFVRKTLSCILHLGNVSVNEFYKLLFQQKKWIPGGLCVVIVLHSMTAYIPKQLYQTAYEAAYHMYLSNIQGKVSMDSLQFIRNEQEDIRKLEEQLVTMSDDACADMQIESELQGRREAMERLMVQCEKMGIADLEQIPPLTEEVTDRFFVDELYLTEVMGKYDRDVLLFMLSAVMLILFTSGLFASEMEHKISVLIYTTKNGRKSLQAAKLRCTVFITLLAFASAMVPGLIGYGHILGGGCLFQKLLYLYEPRTDSRMTILGLLVLICFVKLLLFTVMMALTVFMAKRTGDEFVTSIFMGTAVVVICLVMYFLKINVSTLTALIL